MLFQTAQDTEYDPGDDQALCFQEGDLPAWGKTVLGTALRPSTPLRV